MADALYRRKRHEQSLVADATVAAGEIYQLNDGRAAVKSGLDAAAIGDKVGFCTEGRFLVTKVSAQVWIEGAPIWWDHSANEATCVPQFADRDFYLGTAEADVATGTTTGVVNLNVKPEYVVDLNGVIGGGGGDTAVVLTAGAPSAVNRGGMLELAFDTTAEAQKLDWLSRRSFPVASNWILEAMIEVQTDWDDAAADFNIGVANGTHASDADSITESCFFHLDGNDNNIDAESDDGTTEVAATDTTIDQATGTPVHLVIDGRDHTDIQMYVDGVLVLSGTTFTLAAATGPLKALVHMEKTANDTPGIVQVDMLRVRIMEQPE